MQTLTLTVLDKEYAIHRLDPDADIPAVVFSSNFYSISTTDEEMSIVCEADIHIGPAKTDSGWSCIKVIGPLDFSLTGILAGISTTLADVNISLFVISTYDTDYFLVKSRDLSRTLDALRGAGYLIK
jgi:hypothetical protein